MRRTAFSGSATVYWDIGNALPGFPYEQTKLGVNDPNTIHSGDGQDNGNGQDQADPEPVPEHRRRVPGMLAVGMHFMVGVGALGVSGMLPVVSMLLGEGGLGLLGGPGLPMRGGIRNGRAVAALWVMLHGGSPSLAVPASRDLQGVCGPWGLDYLLR